MNRTIKFRVWDKLLNKWGNPRDFLGISVRGELICENSLNPQNSVVQLFTGLKDRCDKEIFEGDIVEWIEQEDGPPYSTRICKGNIIFCGFGFRVKVRKRLYDFHNNHLCKDYLYKIIGNIFENPDIICPHIS
jgi:uncharacterized phage protein (TIGR01671 family)